MSAIINMTPNNREEIFTAAYNGSFYTITGCGGNLDEWTNGYCRLLKEKGVGEPEGVITFRGKDMNMEYGLTGDNAYPDGLTFLMFPLTGLNMGRLAIFKILMSDRWFDDIVDNNRRRQETINEQG